MLIVLSFFLLVQTSICCELPYSVLSLQRIEPYAMGSSNRLNGQSEPKSNSSGSLSILSEDIAKGSLGRLSISQNLDPVKETKCSGRLSTSQNSDLSKESKSIACMLLLSY